MSEDSDALALGAAIRAIRLDRGFTQDELADKAAISQAAISLYETGQRTPSEDMLKAIARVLTRGSVKAIRERAEKEAA